MRLRMEEATFVGRESERETLMKQALAISTTTTTSPQVCLVHGPAGSGKTLLVHHALRTKARKRINPYHHQHQPQPRQQPQQGSYYFISGKCDQNQAFSPSPYREIATAFDHLLHFAPTERIQNCLKTTESVGILTRLVPSFKKLLRLIAYDDCGKEANDENNKNDSDNDEGEEEEDDDDEVSLLNCASERIIAAFRGFLREFCNADHPLVLLIDDLQWMDENSGRLLGEIINDESIHNFLLIGCYRDELDTGRLSVFGYTSRSTFTDLQIGPLNVGEVGRLVGMVLDTRTSNSSHSNNSPSNNSHDEDEDTTTTCSTTTTATAPDSDDSFSQFTRLIHRKTLGNPYFVIQFLEMLHARELLTYNYFTMNWTWNMAEVDANTKLSMNVVDIVMQRIDRLSRHVKGILIVAAFLGFAVDAQLVEFLMIQEFGVKDQLSRLLSPLLTRHHARHEDDPMEESEMPTIEALNLASMEGLIEFSSSSSSSGEDSCVKFSHNKIQESFYALVPVGNDRYRLHYQIGMSIWQRYTDTDPAFIFLAADQLNRGAAILDLDDADGRLFLVDINYKASLAARRNAVGIETVAMFIQKAIEHASVDNIYWTKSYELLVNVYSFAAELEASRGDFNRSEDYSNTVLYFSRHANETIRSLVSRALAHGVQRDFLQGIKELRKILKLLRMQVLPSSTFSFFLEVIRTRRALNKIHDVDFLEMKNMESDNVILAMKILQHGSVFGWNSDTTFAGLCCLKMIRLTVEHGWCVFTPFALSGYGVCLASLGYEKEAFRFSQLALRSTKGKLAQPDVNIMVHGFLAHFEHPASQSLQPLLAGYRSGLETGDMMCGTICMASYAHVYLFCGLPLKSFTHDMQQFAMQLKLCHQDLPLALLLPTLLLAMNLSGETDDPMDLSRESMKRNLDAYNDNMCIDTAVEDPTVLFVFYLQAFSAYLLGDLNRAEQALERVSSRQHKRFSGTQILNMFFALVDGLIGFALCRRKPKYKWRKLARASLKELENWTKRQSINCIGMLGLLQAESASCFGRPADIVREKYDTAIRQLVRSGFLHYSAIANELAGLHMKRIRDKYWAQHYLGSAAVYYSEWGAVTKVQHLVKMHGSSVVFALAAVSSSAFHGREQYNCDVDSIIRRQSSSSFLL